MALLEIENLSFKYAGSETAVLENINLAAEQGEFILICGESGCGKSTLLRLCKKQLVPKGEKSGRVLFAGAEIEALEERRAAGDIGFVMQNPDDQVVTDKVWHELAFGLESMGVENAEIRRRVAEISGFFGIGDWYRKRTDELSGGQKQLLCLASIMVMQPQLLLLDEPTSQLDPIAAAEFLHTLKKVNEELGVTVILVEHRLEEIFPICDRVVIMDRARILAVGPPRRVGQKLQERAAGHKMQLALPSAVRIFGRFDFSEEYPLTVRESKLFLERNFANTYPGFDVADIDYSGREKAVEIAEGFFRYERESPDILRGLNLTVYKNEILCILGGNGAGKTTMLKVVAGLKRLYRGKLRIWGKKLKEYGGNTLYRHNLASLPQDPRTLFVKNKLADDLEDTAKIMGYGKEEGEAKIAEITARLNIGRLLSAHPYDLSGGEQQKAAFAKVLLTQPKIILMDEPTKGIDAFSKKVLGEILADLKAQGMTVVIVTHDIEFAAEYGDRCGMFFDGQIVSIADPVRFFAANNYYTTAASRISRGLYRNAVTVDMVVELMQRNGRKNG